MQELLPLDQAIKRCPEAELVKMKNAFQVWAGLCLNCLNSNNIYAPDLQIRNIAYLSQFYTEEGAVTRSHKFRLIDIDGLITADGFECIAHVTSAYVQFLKNTTDKEFMPLTQEQFKGGLTSLKSMLESIQQYNVALISLVFDIRIPGNGLNKVLVRTAVADAQLQLINNMVKLLKSFPQGKIELNVPLELQQYCSSPFSTDLFENAIIQNVAKLGKKVKIIECNPTALQTTFTIYSTPDRFKVMAVLGDGA